MYCDLLGQQTFWFHFLLTMMICVSFLINFEFFLKIRHQYSLFHFGIIFLNSVCQLFLMPLQEDLYFQNIVW